MRLLKIRRIFPLFVLACLLPQIIVAQETCEPNYSIPNFTRNDVALPGKAGNNQYNVLLTVGQPFIATATNYSVNSITMGYWSPYLKEPRPPIVRASDGDFQDMVLIEWTVEDDRTGPPATGDEVTLYRNSYILTTLPVRQTQYQDFNVFPGEYYVYGVTTTNDMGESHTDDNIGFLNPNGVITGTVKTPSGNPVIDTKVTLTPNLGRSAFFDGSSYIYYFDARTSANRLFTGLEGNYTIETWFRSVSTDQQTIFAAVDSATANHYVLIELTEEGKLRWQHNPVAGSSGSSSEIITVNVYTEDSEWHHLAAVFDINDMTLYVDGAIVGHTTASGPVDDTVEIVLGKRSPIGSELFLKGRLDDFRIWSGARSWADLRKQMDLTLSGEESGLAAYWKFDEVEGDIIFDLTANDNDGNICGVSHNNITAPVFVGALTDSVGNYAIKGIYYATGYTFTVTPHKTTSIGRSLQFDGTDDYISFQSQRIDLTAGYTVEGWFKTSSASDQTIFAGVDPGDGSHRVSVGTTSEGKVKYSYYASEVVSTGSYNDELWHHYAVTYDNAKMVLYVDGVTIDSSAVTDSIPNLTEMVMARQALEVSAKYFDGYLDEMRIWNSARTYEQVGGTMNQTLQGDEYGLIHYWRINEGTGDLVSDATGNEVTGTVQGALWSEDIPLNEVFVHTYEPESRQATLNRSNTAVDLVNFTDMSMIAVSGFVRYENTACFQEGVEILVNGQPQGPPIYTDADGKFILELEPGSTGKRLSVRYQDHEFLPPFIELPLIVTPITGLYYDDAVTRDISGKVAGGVCEFPITPSQGQIEVTFRAINGCIETTVVPDSTTGRFEVKDLPPLIYQATIDHPDPSINDFFTGDTMSLEDNDGSINFVYRSTPEVAMTGFPLDPCGLRIMEMNQSYDVTINVFETYTSGGDTNTCPSDSGTLTIIDAISDMGEGTINFENGTAPYTIVGGLPNILSGGDHPYQKNIQVTATDDLGRNAVTEEWVYVTGHRPRETAFATTTPEIPILMLRDPPGDGSYSHISEGTTIEQSFGISMIKDESETAYIGGHMGVDVEIGVGFVVTTTVVTDVTLDVTDEWSTTITQSSFTEQTWSMSTTETFTTSAEETFVGEGGDIYMGGAMNILYGITDVLEVTDACTVSVTQDIILVPDGFATTYIYTESHILNNLIPGLYTIGDTTSAERWQSFIATNQQLKQDAEFSRNLSFDAGAIFEYTETTTLSETESFEFQMFVNEEVAMATGLTVNGVGVSGGFMINTAITTGKSETTTQTYSNTIGFVLNDGDIGDNFTINVKQDKVYGTPVFQLVSGVSSCPWEANTVSIDEAQLSITPLEEIDVPPDEAAVFTLNIGNVSQADADREYHLRVINASNPDGAVIAVNGIIIQDFMSFFIDAGTQVEATMTVYRGPDAYDYDGLQLQLVPPCEYENWQAGAGLQLADTVSFSVEYLVPCSESNIAVPEDNWLITAADELDTLWVTVDGYDRFDENLDRIELQYRQAPGGGKTTFQSSFLATSDNEIRFTDDQFKTEGRRSGTGKVSQALRLNNNQVGSPFFSDWQKTGADEGARRDGRDKSLTHTFPDRTRVDYLTRASQAKRRKVDMNGAFGFDELFEKKINDVENSAGNGDWFVGYTVPKDSLIDDYVLMPWNISPTIVIDGTYELRARAICTEGMVPGSSPIITGMIDRNPPSVLGAPQPADGILNLDDEIAIIFNEDVECGAISVGAGHITLTNTVTGDPVDFTYTCGGNTIVIDPNIQNHFIENQTLRASVGPVEDLYGNVQTEAIVWEFFVNRNPIEWVGEDISNVVIFHDETYATTRQLVNNGGSNRSYEIINVPSWLTVSPLEGILTPGSIQKITFTLNEQLGVGFYRTTVYASGTMGDEPMAIDIRILCYPPEWFLDPAYYRYTMTITATLSTEDELSDDAYDMVGVFVDDEIRGVANVEFVPELDGLANTHPYEVFLTVYSNEASGENLLMRVWDATECAELGMIEEEYTFAANAVHGTPTTPVSITATDQIIQKIAYPAGWTWFSLNLESSDMSINTVLENLSPTDGDLIKSQTVFDQYVSGFGWVGTLDTLRSEPMYQIRISNPDTLETVGYAVDVEKDTIPVVSGWNWIGYPPQTGMDVDVALTSLEAAATGDLIKSQFAFAQFVEGLGWIGSLRFMKPRLGYQMKAMNPGELLYPFEIPGTPVPVLSKNALSLLATGGPDWPVNSGDYEYNMTVIGMMNVDGAQPADSLDMVGAFYGDECRGVARPMYIEALNRYLVFLMVYGSDTEDETIEFKFYDKSEDYTWMVNETVEFEPDLMLGAVEEPYLLTTRVLGIGDPGYIPGEFSLGQNYPNPFNPVTTIGFGLPEDSHVELAVYDILGREIRRLVSEMNQAGYYLIAWDGRDNSGNPVPSGVYFYQMTAGRFHDVKKLVLLK